MPSSVTPTGIMAEALSKLEALIAGTAFFRAEVGVSLATEAKERIYYPHLENSGLDSSWLRNMPYCIITNGPLEAQKDSDGTFDRGGRLTVLFRSESKYDITDPSTLKDSLLAFLNYTDGVLSEIEENSHANDNITIQSYSEVIPAQLNPPLSESDAGELKPYWDRAFEFTFNPVGNAGGGGGGGL